MPAADRFANMARTITAPSDAYFSITPSDTNDFAEVANSIRVAFPGDVMAVRIDGVVVPFYNCQPGETLPIRARRVNATGTTASGLAGL